jgi:hypothetical protein
MSTTINAASAVLFPQKNLKPRPPQKAKTNPTKRKEAARKRPLRLDIEIVADQ